MKLSYSAKMEVEVGVNGARLYILAVINWARYLDFATIYSTLHYPTLQYTRIQYNTLQYTTFYTPLHYNTVQYNTMHYPTIHYTAGQYVLAPAHYCTIVQFRLYWHDPRTHMYYRTIVISYYRTTALSFSRTLVLFAFPPVFQNDVKFPSSIRPV